MLLCKPDGTESGVCISDKGWLQARPRLFERQSSSPTPWFCITHSGVNLHTYICDKCATPSVFVCVGVAPAFLKLHRPYYQHCSSQHMSRTLTKCSCANSQAHSLTQSAKLVAIPTLPARRYSWGRERLRRHCGIVWRWGSGMGCSRFPVARPSVDDV